MVSGLFSLFPKVIHDFFLCALKRVVYGFAAFAEAFGYLACSEAFCVFVQDLHLKIAEYVVAVVENVVGDVFDDEQFVGAVGRRRTEGVAEGEFGGLPCALAGFAAACDRLA